MQVLSESVREGKVHKLRTDTSEDHKIMKFSVSKKTLSKTKQMLDHELGGSSFVIKMFNILVI